MKQIKISLLFCNFAGCTEERVAGEKYCKECLKALRTEKEGK